METKTEKIQSVHPALQAMLPKLAQSMAREWRPIFPDREEAEDFIAKFQKREVGPALGLNPVWAIDHADLTRSRVVGWSVTEYIS